MSEKQKVAMKRRNDKYVAIAVRLRSAAVRIMTLADRLGKIGGEEKPEDCNEYLPGFTSPLHYLSELFGTGTGLLDRAVADMVAARGLDSQQAMLEYHYENVTDVVCCYFFQVLEDKIKPCKKVTDEMVSECKITAALLVEYANAIMQGDILK